MATTATRPASGTSKPSTAAASEITDVEVTLPDEAYAVVNELAKARLARIAAERQEKELKAKLFAMLPEHKKGTKLVLKVAGAIRGTVSWRQRSGIDADLLLQGFPEAYDACRSETDYQQLNPA